MTLQDLAEALDTTRQTVSRIERGDIRLSQDWLDRFATVFGVAPVDLLDVDEGVTTRRVPIIGEITEGERVVFFDPDDYGYAPLHSDMEDSVAVVVRGSCMLPFYADGTLLFYDRASSEPVASLLGTECAVTTRSGDVFIRKIYPGSYVGTYRLVSALSPDMDNVEIKHAAPIEWTHRRVRKSA